MSRFSRSMEISMLLLVDAWILNIVSWTVHMDHLQHFVMFISVMVLSFVALVICGFNLGRTVRELQRLIIRREVYACVLEIFDKAEKSLEEKGKINDSKETQNEIA